MKNIIIGTMLVVLSSTAFARVESCSEKTKELEAQIQIAKKHNNTHQLRGLETALENVKLHCTEDDQIQKANYEIQEKKLKVSERENDLKKAQLELKKAELDGRSDKIADKKEKVMEKQTKLEKAQLELKEAQDNPLVH